MYAPHIAQFQVVARVEHAAIGIAAALYQAVFVFFGRRYEHFGAVKVLGEQRFGNFRAKVPQVYAQRVCTRLF